MQMKWFDRWLAKKVEQAWNGARESKLAPQLSTIDSDSADIDHRNTLRFTVTPAQGGMVLSVNRYDSRKDENYRSLYVIDENEDYSKKIADILKLEVYKI
jgi:hypothetical protein